MPALAAKTLSGETVTLPAKTGKLVVLVFGFGRSAKAESATWGKQLMALQQEKFDFNFYQVAVLAGAPRFTHGLITRSMRADVPPAFQSHFLLLTSGDKPWRDLLNVTDDASAYVALCTPAGQVQWQTRGTGQTQFDALRAQLRKHTN